MKKYFIIAAGVAILIGGVAFSYSQKKSVSVNDIETQSPDEPLSVRAESITEKRSASFEFSYPGTVSSESEAILTAQVSGTITSANLSLNSPVATGQFLFKIDVTGSSLGQKNGTQSADLQTSALSLKNAKKDYQEAVHQDNQTRSITSENAKIQAKNDRDIAQIAYTALLDKYLVKSPIGGTVTIKNVSVGDTVSPGTPLATISKGKKIIRFFINDTEHTRLSPLQEIFFTKDTAKKNLVTGKILRISQTADPISRRFLVEADSADPAFKNFPSGSIVTIFASTSEQARADSFFLPLSAVLREQDGSAIFIYADGKAKRVPVDIQNIDGETVELSGITDGKTLIITTNVKRLKDGDAVTLDQQ